MACCLIDGDRRWGEIFNGRDLFVSWTGDKARAGSTKHGSADAKYCELGRYAAQRPPGTTLTMASLPWLAGRERRTRDSIRTPSSVNTAPLTDSQERHLRLVQARGTPELVAIGRWYGREYLADEVVYDDRTESPCWWMYRDKRWRLLLNTSLDIIHDLQVRRYQVAGELERQGMRTLAAAMANDAVWGSLKGPPEFWAGLATELRGVPPEPADHYLGTPDCVVDLRDGSTLPHAPAFGIRSLTRGRYLGTDAADLVGVITERMGHGRVFSEETMWEYLRLIALAMTRKAQDHRALTLIIGKEGSGKEGAANLAREALGELAIGVSVDWFKPRHSDIDATTASILERRPVLVTVGEIGGDTHVGASRVLDKTGKAETNARRPHGPLLTGTIRAAVFTTSVEVPTFPAGTGIRRRLAVLPTLRKLKTAEKSSPTQAHYDAVITLAVNLCAKVYDASNYRPPEGHHAKKGKVIAEMDPVTDWLLSLPDSVSGTRLDDLLKQARAELSLKDDDLTMAIFGRRINASERWISFRGTSQKAREQGTVILSNPEFGRDTI